MHSFVPSHLFFGIRVQKLWPPPIPLGSKSGFWEGRRKRIKRKGEKKKREGGEGREKRGERGEEKEERRKKKERETTA